MLSWGRRETSCVRVSASLQLSSTWMQPAMAGELRSKVHANFTSSMLLTVKPGIQPRSTPGGAGLGMATQPTVS